jgi:gamma-glutamyl:cysteine ligase YbdK (ATP-grasp superfamily)
MTIGTEHEYSVNDDTLKPLPIVDRIIEELHGEIENEFKFGNVNLSKELQKHVIEFVPSVPQTSIPELEQVIYDGIRDFNHATSDRFALLGLGMHPLLRLEQTTYWDHEDKDIYDAYDRVFDLKKHGWLNIQALQVNTHYESDKEMITNFNRLRSLLPYLVAITASSPFVEGRTTSTMDNRLLHYRHNQERVPLVCNNLVPEKLRSRKHHDDIIRSIYRDLKTVGANELCHEWIDSRGVIIRYHRECLELKACDEQECVRSDMAVTAFVLALLRAELQMEEDHEALLELTEVAIAKGTMGLRPELRRLYRAAYQASNPEERPYLALIEKRIEEGSIAELMCQRVQEGDKVGEVALAMASCLRNNRPYRQGD